MDTQSDNVLGNPFASHLMFLSNNLAQEDYAKFYTLQ